MMEEEIALMSKTFLRGQVMTIRKRVLDSLKHLSILKINSLFYNQSATSNHHILINHKLSIRNWRRYSNLVKGSS